MNEIEIQEARIELEKQTAIQTARLERLGKEFEWAKRQVWILFVALRASRLRL
jgi:hypothetical protein